MFAEDFLGGDEVALVGAVKWTSHLPLGLLEVAVLGIARIVYFSHAGGSKLRKEKCLLERTGLDSQGWRGQSLGFGRAWYWLENLDREAWMWTFGRYWFPAHVWN